MTPSDDRDETGWSWAWALREARAISRRLRKEATAELRAERLFLSRTTVPLEPLLAATNAETPAHLARLVGVHTGNMTRVVNRGLSLDQADRWAVVCGFHPTEVWGDAFWVGTDLDTREEAA